MVICRLLMKSDIGMVSHLESLSQAKNPELKFSIHVMTLMIRRHPLLYCLMMMETSLDSVSMHYRDTQKCWMMRKQQCSSKPIKCICCTWIRMRDPLITENTTL